MSAEARVRLRRWVAGCGAGVLALLLLSSAQGGIPRPRSPSCDQVSPPPVELSADGRTAHMRLDVLTYNIEGLGWPAREGRAAELAQIGDRLAELRRNGQAPDIIVFQEMFSHAAVKAVHAAGYPAEVAGPSRFEHRDLPSDGRVPGHRDWREGELGLRMTSGGLAIVSRYPILAHKAEPFSHRACAGLDCLSNKGALFAAVAIPGVPDPVQVFDSHMNSRHASGAPLTRTLASHHLESQELADFIGVEGDAALPTVLAGDFNMRHSAARYAVFQQDEPLTDVPRYCREEAPRACDVRIGWTSDTPWIESEDLQLFRPGARVSIRPVRVESLFDGRTSGPKLSDHDGLRVIYDLSWPVDTPPGPGACKAGAPVRKS